MRVAVDETRDGAEPASVDILDVAGERREVAHGSHRLDPSVAGDEKRVLDHLDVPELASAEWRVRASRSGELHEVADEEPGHVAGTPGRLTT
jgi:hypothetical protein